MAGTVTVTHSKFGVIRRIVADWVADAAAATVPDTVLPNFEGRILELTTNPGAVAPTDNYDVTLIDEEGSDRLQALGANRDTANTETVPIVYSGSTIHPPVGLYEALTLKLAGNAVNSATGRIIIVYAAG
jgi:hypothetical protein